MRRDEPDLDYWRTVGDPEADQVVASIQRRMGPTSICGLPRTLGRWSPGKSTADLPLEAIDYLHKAYDLGNFDLVRLTRAQESYRKYAEAGQIVLGVYSLPVLYIQPEITQTLMSTGQLVLHVRRRLNETWYFVNMAMTPRALNQAGDGWQWMRKVRLTHAVMRAIRASGNLCSEPGRGSADSGFDAVNEIQGSQVSVLPAVPALNQVDLAYVLLTFSWAIVDGLSRLGISMSEQEKEDHIHGWAVVGHMIGVVDELLPGGRCMPDRPVEHAEALFEKIRSRLLGPDSICERVAGAEEGRQLMAALLVVLVDEQRRSIPPRFRGWVERYAWLDAAIQDLPRTFVRKLSGKPTARRLRLGRAPLLHWILGQIGLALMDLRHWKKDQCPWPDTEASVSDLSVGLF